MERSQKPDVKLTPDFEKVAEKSDDRIVLRFDNPPISMPPKDAPPRFGWMRIMEYSDFSDWSAVSSRFDQMFRAASAIASDSAIAEEAARIAAKHTSQRDRAEAALDLVQRQVRYVYVGLVAIMHPPAPMRRGIGAMATARAKPRSCSPC